jgi:DNA-binding Xre family transcriptional regulator
MIKVKIQEIARKHNVTNAYQLQNATGFYPSKAANLWKGEWKKADLETLNTLCNLFKCMPNDILEFTPDEVEED